MIRSLIRTEFARLTSSRIGVLALVALMAVPVIYGGLYLWGNEDPYKNLDRVPAAVVVEDTGTTVDDVAVNYGQDAAEALLDDHSFGWVEVSAARAKSGIVAGDYDFGITFPQDFSADLASASGDEPTEALLELTTSDTNSYLSTTLAERAAESVRVKVAEQLGVEAAGTLLEALESVREGLIHAADGAATLADGATTAADGARSLSEGAATATTGAASLASGVGALSEGAAALSSGLGQLDGQAAALPNGTAALSTGAASVADGAATAASGEAALTTPTQQAAALSAALAAQLADGIISQEEAPVVQAQSRQLAALTAGVRDGTASLNSGLATLSGGAAQVASGAATLNTQAPALSAAVHSAATGAAKLATGASSASSGATKLASGVGALSTGASDLSTGVETIASGAGELSTALGDAVGEIPGTTDAERAKAAAAIADPVMVEKTALTEAQNYGGGLAPFFMSLAAWIGMYALFLLVRPLSARALTAVRRPIRTTLAGWLTPALLGAVQVVALFAAVHFGLGLEVANPLGLVSFMVFVSLSFAAIVLALNVWLGSVGQFIGLMLMVVQLVTAGGTFPWQTLPKPLDTIHQLLPMSHSVDGIRQLMYGGSATAVWQAVLPLAVWLVASLGIAALGAVKQGRVRTLRELRPSPIGA